MGRDITCEDCSAKRSNAAYKNTRYCKACRLLRDLVYLDRVTRPCKGCRKVYAPTSRRDAYCGTCCFGSVDEGLCKFCDVADAELYRAGIAVCVRCVRDPKQRPRLVAGLRKGQRERRQANSHANQDAS